MALAGARANKGARQQAEVLGAIKRQQLRAAATLATNNKENSEEACSRQWRCCHHQVRPPTQPAWVASKPCDNQLATNRPRPKQTQTVKPRDTEFKCPNLRCEKIASPRPPPLPVEHEHCAKCQLIVRWTSAQARLARQAAQAAEVQMNARTRASDLQLAQLDRGISGPEAAGQQHRYGQMALQCGVTKSNSDHCLAKGSSGHASDRCQSPTEEDEGAEISSLTDTNTSTTDDRERPGGHHSVVGHDPQDKWSVSSCYDEPTLRATNEPAAGDRRLRHAQKQQQVQSYMKTRAPSLRRRRIGGVSIRLAPLGLRKRRPAPLPPPARPIGRQPAPFGPSSAASDKSVDSGHTSGPDSSVTGSGRLPQHTTTTAAGANVRTQKTEPNLLTESEVFSIEHFLRSHKSSIYVCGCMANLYLTNTNLVDNGRCSKPSSEGWQLSKTGVPVLTFDSGLTRNRSKRRLSINLTERGSGFVLWSDIIDHLSNYRAYCAQIHGNPEHSQATDGSKKEEDTNSNTFDTFHVMYLSTNHRIMVGLSFDDAKCARLFLKQVEMVTSDPQNIALTGPKLAHRLVSVSRLGRLLARGHHPDPASLKELKPEDNQNRKVMVMPQPVEYRDVYLDRQQQQHGGVRRSRLSRLISSGSRRFSCRPGCAALTPVAGANDYTWSTLKRAIRFGHKARAMISQGTEIDDELQQTLPSAFAPKPLASLAMAGKLYRGGKKLPRKCDISAPCLFQHVTRVDLSNLDKLYSRSLVSGHPITTTTTTTTTTASVSQADPKTASELDADTRRPQQDQQQANKQKLSMISHPNSGCTSTSTSSSSSTSCYSSASISPASSEYESRQQLQQNQSRPNERGRRQHQQLSRPLPPRVPQRGPPSTDPTQVMQINRHQQQQQQQQSMMKQPHSQQASASKIQAIIRDLQAQTTAELVEAKRKLMADIADQVIARAAAVSHL